MRAHPRSGSLMRAHPVILTKYFSSAGIYFSVSLPRSGTFHVTRPVIPSKSSIWITYPGQINLAIAVNLWLIANQKFSFLIYCLRFRSLKELTYGNFLPCMLNLSRFFTVQLSRYFAVVFSRDSFYIIINCLVFVNNFLIFFVIVYTRQLWNNNTPLLLCQHISTKK